jgi:phage baseplate assembly protein W
VSTPARIDIDFAFGFDARGRTRSPVSYNEHVRDLVEQILFTAPGERPNRPDYGSGLLQLVFAPNSPELAATIQYTTQAAVQRWLGDVVDLVDLRVDAHDATLQVEVSYVVRRTGEQVTSTFRREVGA